MIRTSILAAAGLFASTLAPVQAMAAPTNTSGWAVVDFDGTLLKGQNVVSVEKINTNNYVVRFNSKLKKCALTATPNGTLGITVESGEIAVTPDPEDSRQVTVSTADSSGNPLALPFSVLATC